MASSSSSSRSLWRFISPAPLKILILLSILIPSVSAAMKTRRHSSSSSFETDELDPTAVSLCCKTPYPNRCLESSKLSISININPSILGIGIQSLQHAFQVGSTLAGSISRLCGSGGIVEKQRGSIQDCRELHQLTLKHIQSSITESNKKSAANAHNVRAFLSAALTNKDTCLEGLASATGVYKSVLVNNLVSFYQLVSNSLASFSMAICDYCHPGRKLLRFSGGPDRQDSEVDAFPAWLSGKDRRLLLQSEEYDPSSILVVAQDGSGNFSTISDAVEAAEEDTAQRVIIYVKEGVYEENVDIPSNKPYIALLGDGIGRTIITCNRSVADGWTTFRTATVAVAGDGFLARDITFKNTAGPAKHQAVALRVNSDLSVVYRCSIEGYQDTLYVHSLRQFYRENMISGTVDFIFGNAAVVFQACKIMARRPMDGQFIAITAQSRDDPNENTGISIQNCSIYGGQDLMRNVSLFKGYLGRPWRVFSRTVFMDSYFGSFIDPAGWIKWPGNDSVDSLYYGEYGNRGPGSGISGRISWPGYHIMDSNDAANFTVPALILGDQWLDSTAVPYDTDV